MSQFNVENTAHMTPGALAAAQDTAQGQEIIREGIRIAQTVQASEAAADVQRVHRRNEDEEREGRRQGSQDAYERSDSQEKGTEEGRPPAPPLVVKGQEPGAKKFELYV